MIVAETGADMTRFPTAGHLASWAGTVPGSNESAGRVKSTTTRPGNPYLQGALGDRRHVLRPAPGHLPGAKYRRIAARRGPQKANVAVQHAMLVAIWNMVTNGTFYDDPGDDYFTRLNPDEHEPAPSANSKPWATQSPSPAPAPPDPGNAHGADPACPNKP